MSYPARLRCSRCGYAYRRHKMIFGGYQGQPHCADAKACKARIARRASEAKAVGG